MGPGFEPLRTYKTKTVYKYLQTVFVLLCGSAGFVVVQVSGMVKHMGFRYNRVGLFYAAFYCCNYLVGIRHVLVGKCEYYFPVGRNYVYAGNNA